MFIVRDQGRHFWFAGLQTNKETPMEALRPLVYSSCEGTSRFLARAISTSWDAMLSLTWIPSRRHRHGLT